MHPLIRRRSGRKVSSPRRWRGVNGQSHPRSFVPAQRRSSFTSPFHDAFPAKRRVGFPPPVPTRSHDHRLRFTVPAHWPDFNSADLPFGRGAHARFGRCAPLLDSACSLMACNLGLCCVHSFGSRADRSPPEGASCATMSSHTCYRTSRSFHFPFWAVCSLSGTQPEFSLGRLHPHVEKDILSLFLASSQFNVLRASTRVRRPPGPTWPGSTRAEAAQHGSEDGSGSTCALQIPELSQRAFLRLTVRGSSDMYPVHRSVPQRA